MKYRPEIDGLRALAVLSVLFYHCQFGLPGGYIGVDVFFVISGYLITRLLIRDVVSGEFSYLNFWERRIRRLLPALTLVTLCTAAVSWIVLLPYDLQDFGGALASQSLLIQNIYLWLTFKGGYFADPPEIRPLLHTWSLGVEEQFYLLFPLVIVSCLRSGILRKRTTQVLAWMAAFSLLLSWCLTSSHRVFAYFLLPTRAWELLLGSALVYANPVRVPGAVKELLGWIGLGLIGYSSCAFNRQTPFPGCAALVPCLGSALFLLSNDQSVPTSSGRLLSARGFVALGRISYSLYLWHWPIIAWGHYLGVLTSLEARIGVALTSIILAYLSWRWVEEPARRKVILPRRLQIYRFFVVYVIVSISIGMALYAGAGFPRRWSEQANRFAGARHDRAYLHEVDLQLPLERIPRLGSRRNGQVSFLLWGDSHAMSLAPVFDSLGQEYDVGGLQLTQSAVAPMVKNGLAPLALALLKNNDISHVFLVARWQKYSGPSFEQDLQATIQVLNERGVRVVLVCDVPLQQVEYPPRALALAARWPSLRPRSVSWQTHRKEASFFYTICESLRRHENGGLKILDPARLITDWDNLGEGGMATYVDDHHLSDHGARMLSSIFEPTFRDMAKKEFPGLKGKAP